MVACWHGISLLVLHFISHSFVALTGEISSWILEEIPYLREPMWYPVHIVYRTPFSYDIRCGQFWMGQDGTSIRKPSTGGHRSPVEGGGWGVGERLPYKNLWKEWVCPSEFWKEPLRGTNPVILFSAQYPNRSCSRSQCTPFEAQHPKRKRQNLIFNL